MTAAEESISDVLIDVQHVTYTHWNKTEPTLHDVSLQIQRGTLNILVGPSGSGKSTLCDLFNGVIPHLLGGKMKGDVWVDGVNIREAKVNDLAQTIGRVFQDPENMFATLYVEDEIAFGPENLRFEATDIKEIVEELLEQTDLVDHRHNLVWNLSGGQVQKLGLAAVLAMHPQMIVLDEPTSNLDPAATQSVHELILELRREGITILLVSRELDEILADADQLLVLEDGRLLATGPPCTVLREHGEYMVDSLGAWLPETCEIGISLLRAGLLGNNSIPITIDETISVLNKVDLLSIGPKDELKESRNHVTTASIASDKEVLISGRDLHYAYPGGTEALRGIDLDIIASEWLMIVGRNGAGKSTLAKMLVGLVKPQLGTLTMFGEDARCWKVEELANHIALVFQNPEHQFLTDKVSDEISYSLLAQGITDPDEVKHRTDEILEQLGLQDVTDVHPFALSAGLKRRLGVAVMLVGDPEVLVVDEPTYGQDREMTHTLMALMRNIQERGVAVLMITHDMRLVGEYGERVVVMSNGIILFDGASSDLFNHQEVLKQANLRCTILHDLLGKMRRQGTPVPDNIRHTSDVLRLLNLVKVSE
jgi:energy-coupling factor transporter ATP-binding protein EcfA2